MFPRGACGVRDHTESEKAVNRKGNVLVLKITGGWVWGGIKGSG